MLNAMKGKKTYVIAGLAAASAAATALGHPVPDWAWMLLNAAGLGAVRSAISG